MSEQQKPSEIDLEVESEFDSDDESLMDSRNTQEWEQELVHRMITRTQLMEL
jgi:hypothetical protein